MTTLVAFPTQVWAEAREHLLGAPWERFGFFLAGAERTPDGYRFGIRKFIPITDDEVEPDPFAERVVKLDAILRVVNQAKREGLAIVEAHTHPGAGRAVRFSNVDREGLEEFSGYALKALGGRPYGALVLGKESLDGVYFETPGHSKPITRVTAGGLPVRIRVSDAVRPRGQPEVLPDRHHRQVAFLGAEGQRRLGELHVAVVGAGGLGSHLIQQLAYLGARSFIVIDADLVDETSLNRLIGAVASDIGRPKVDVARDLVNRIAAPGQATVLALPRDVRHPESIAAVAGADIVFGCLDNDGGRLVLNELSRALVLPYFDLSSGISAPEGHIEEAGGRLAVVLPEGPCLFCMAEIDAKEARYFLSTKDEQMRDRRQGYVEGWDVPAPSVVSLNGVVASFAVSEFLFFATGLGAPPPLTYYYLREQGADGPRLARRHVERRASCYTCSLTGKGNTANVKRYWTALAQSNSPEVQAEGAREP